MARDWLDDIEAVAPVADLSGFQQELARLAALSPVEYDKTRADTARRLGVRAATLDGEVSRARPARADDEAKGVSPIENIEAWPTAVDGARLAETIRDRLRAHVIFDRASDADAAALWVLGAWAFDAWALFPRILITAPEKQCGKTVLASTIAAMVPKALAASNATGAALFRSIEKWRPTLILDELDTYEKENLDLRNVLNSGHDKENAMTLRCVGDDHEPRAFSTWAPMVLSGIGKPAATVVSRSVVIGLRRKLPTERVERRPVDLRAMMLDDRRRAMRWAADHVAALTAMRDELPDCGDDRRRDNFEPLYRVALALGGSWPSRLEAAYLVGADDDEADASAGVMLLRDLAALFEADGADRMTTANIVGALTGDDELPWHEWRHGKPATARTFAKLLAPYGVRPVNIKTSSGSVSKGYRKADIAEASKRYAILSATPLPRCNQRENTATDPLPATLGSGYETSNVVQYQRGSGVADTKEGIAAQPVADTETDDPDAWRREAETWLR